MSYWAVSSFRLLFARCVRLLAVVGLVATSLVAAAVTAPPAAAQACAGAPTFTVATETALNDAITCFNTATTAVNYEIALQNSITSTGSFAAPGGAGATAFMPITQPLAGSSLTIKGDTNTLTGMQLNGVFVEVGADVTVTFEALTITAAGSGLRVYSGNVVVEASTFSGNNNGLFAADSSVVVSGSTFSGNTTNGVMAFGGSAVVVSGSTFSGHAGNGVFAANGGSVVVSGSTFSGNTSTGVNALGGSVALSNSTISDGVTDFTGTFLTVVSSVVNGCGGSTPVGAGGNNVGDCVVGGSAVPVAALADNGCAASITALGATCPFTSLLPVGSAALGAGTCTGVPVGLDAAGNVVNGTVSVDQRDLARTPAAAGCDAGAVEGFDCLAGPLFSVSTEDDLNSAIHCFNTATVAADYEITLLNSITSTGSFATLQGPTAFMPITQQGAGFSLTVHGATHTLNASQINYGLFVEVGTGVGVTLEALTITNARLTGLIVERGNVDVHASTITGNGNGVSTFNAGTSVVVSGSTISNNVRNGSGTGVYANTGSSVVVSGSTISGNEEGVFAPNGGSVVVLGSTVSNNPNLGLQAAGGSVVVSGSTVSNNGAIGSSLTVVSSIVDGCGGSTPVAAGGNNVGDCVVGGSAVPVQALADNGCAASITALGATCPFTSLLPVGSAALGAGTCTGVPVGLDAAGNVVNGTVSVDQRDLPRTPAAAGCDAGAVEGFDCSGPLFSVGTEDDLNSAIHCFNTATVAADYEITLLNSITSTGSFATTTLFDAAFLPITQQIAGFSLTVKGATNTLDALQTGYGVFVETGAGVDVTFEAVTITNADLDGLSVASGDVYVDASTITGNVTGVTASGAGGSVVVSGSTISDNSNEGVFATAGGSVVVSGSTISDNGTGVQAAAGSVVVSGSTISDNTLRGVYAVAGGSVVVSGSTVTDSGTGVVITGAGSSVTAVSSIVNGCGAASPVAAGGNNVGDCVTGGSSVPVAALDDNGCAAWITALGAACPQTSLLPVASAALGAGTCTNVPIGLDAAGNVVNGTVSVDQRDLPRTPAAAGCDAGAVEAATYMLTIDLTVTGVAPTSPWVFGLSAVAPCFVANTSAASQNVTLLAGGSATAVEVFEGCQVTVTPPTAAGYTMAPATAQVVTVTANTTVNFVAQAMSPVGVADVNLPVVEDTATNLAVLGNDTDTDTPASGLSVDAASLSTPVNGGSVAVVTVAGVDQVQYTPALNYVGTDSFTYQVSDGISLSAATSVTVVVSAVNDAPVGVADVNLAVVEDTATVLGVLGNDTDVDTPASGLSVDAASLSTPVNGGSVSVDAATGDVQYTPALNYVGTDSFTYRVSDGSLLSGVTNVSVVVSAVDDPPVGVADVNLAVVEDTATNLAVLGNDTDTDTPASGLSVDAASLSTPVNGGSVAVVTVAGIDQVEYTPPLNYVGTDSFTYQVSDGTSLSAATSVTVVVSAVNDAPVGVADMAPTAEDVAVAVNVLANDSDVETATSALVIAGGSVTAPGNGVVTFLANQLLYTPNANFVGTDSFTYQVSDGSLTAPPATVTITVSAVDDAPVGVADPASTNEDAAVTINVLGNDTDVDTPTAGLTVLAGTVSTPGNGMAAIVAGGVEYTPNPNFFGTDSFTYQVFDGTTVSAATTVTVTVNPVDDAPAGVADAASTLEDTPVTLTLVSNDTDIDTATSGLSVAAGSLTSPANGSVVLVAGGVEYTPNLNFSGTDSFDYQATDGTSTSAATTVTITIASVLDAPVVVGDNTAIPVASGTGAVNINVLVNDSAVGGDPIDGVTATNGAQGTVVVNADLSITYTPGVMSALTDMFTYTVCSGTACATGTVTLTFTAPTCQGVTATIWGTAANNVIVGTAGNDVIVGDAGNDVINAGLGDDLICGDAGSDRIDAGAGNDRIYGDTGDDLIDAGAGNDLVFAGEGNDNVTAGAGNDRVRAQQGQDIIDGGAGDDFLYGGIGGDDIDGGLGDDTIGGMGGGDQIDAGDGNDRVWGGFGQDIIDGGGGDDVINGLIGNDLIRGGDGDDTLHGDRGQDRIFGDAGNDNLRGGNSIDTLNGNAGDDDLRGGKANDDLFGGPGTDSCVGNLGTDTASTTCETTLGIP